MAKMIRLHKAVFFLGGYCGKESKAQSTLEYAVLVICLVAALLMMQVYLKRSAQGRLRQIGDELGSQYAPRNTSGISTVSYNSTSTTIVKTLSERQLNLAHPGANIDLNNDGDYDDDDVFATETLSVLGTWNDANKNGIIDSGEITGGSETTQKGDETVGTMESSLY